MLSVIFTQFPGPWVNELGQVIVLQWHVIEAGRSGRAVECGGLENRCGATHRGFESLLLRQRHFLHHSILKRHAPLARLSNDPVSSQPWATLRRPIKQSVKPVADGR